MHFYALSVKIGAGNIDVYKRQVLDNVLIAKHMRARHNVFSATFRLSRREEERMRQEAMALLEEQNLDHLRDEVAGSLPYGLQRRLEIARALATEPKLLLLDEPAAGMNPQAVSYTHLTPPPQKRWPSPYISPKYQ